MGAPGDRALVKIVKAAKTHAFGRLEKILEPAHCRIEPDCPAYRLCGGCCYRHITYQAELEIRRHKGAAIKANYRRKKQGRLSEQGPAAHRTGP